MFIEPELRELFNKDKLEQVLFSGDESTIYIGKPPLNDERTKLHVVSCIIGISNTKSGYIIFGVNNGKYVGIKKRKSKDNKEILKELNEYIRPSCKIHYKEESFFYGGGEKLFGFLYIETTGKLYMTNIDGEYRTKKGKRNTLFKSGNIFIIRNGKPVRPDSGILTELMKKRSIRENHNESDFEELDVDIYDKITYKSGQIQNINRSDYTKFIGREEYIDKIKEAFNSRHFIISISGIGGVGKTALAREVSEIAINKGIFEAVIWTSSKLERLTTFSIKNLFTKPTTLESLIDTILDTFDYDIIEEKFGLKYKVVLKLLQEKKCLIVIDNYETIEDVSLMEFIMNIPGETKILITSRKKPDSASRHIILESMNLEEATDLIIMDAEAKSIDKLLIVDKKYYLDIHNSSGGIPLAIRWMVGMIGSGLGIGHVCRTIGKAKNLVLDFCFEEMYNKHLSKNAERILLSFPIYDTAPDKRSIQFVTDIKDDAYDEGITELTSLSLIYEKDTEDVTRVYYDILPLTRAYALLKLELKVGLENTFRKKYTELSELTHIQKAVIDRVGSSLEELGAQTDDSKLAAIQAQTALVTYQNGQKDKARIQFEEAIKIDPNFAYVYKLWGRVELREQHIANAKELYETAKNIDPSDPYIWLNLAKIEEIIDNNLKAKEILIEGLEATGNNSLLLLKIARLNTKLKLFLLADQQFKELFSLEHDNLKINYIISGLIHNLRLWGIQMAINYYYDDALEKYKETLPYIEQAFENDQEDNWIERENRLILKNMGRAYLELGDYNEALFYLMKALNLSEFTFFWKKHNAIVYKFIADCYLSMNRLYDAKKYCESSLIQNENIYAKELLSKINMLLRR